MKKGFTLVELLAVIAILALIALIVVPIVTNIIYDSKKRTEKQSVELYGRAIENAVSAYFVKYPNDNAVTLSQLESEDLIKNKGNKVECDIVQIVDREVYLDECTVGDVKVNYTYGKILIPGILISDADSDGKISKGDKYSYKVNDKDTFNFYVLTDPTLDGEVNLIMDRNVCNYAEDFESNTNEDNDDYEYTCTVSWFGTGNNNRMGPITAMEALYNATKNWTNVADMDMSEDKAYQDEWTLSNNSYGYGKVETTSSGVKITKRDGTESGTILYDEGKSLKARLPKLSELEGAGCTTSNESCPMWLVDYLSNKNFNGSTNKYEGSTNMGIVGYWLLASNSDGNDSYYAEIGYDSGRITMWYTGYNDIGIRPVITVPITMLTNKKK